MATPNPLGGKRCRYHSVGLQRQGDAYANPLSDDDWQRLAKVKDLTPGEMTAEPTMITTWMMKTRTGPRPGRGRNLQVIPVLRWPGNRERKAERAYRLV